MPTNYVSYNNIIDRLEAFASGHKLINQFSHGIISLPDLPKDSKYPCMHVVPGDIIVGKGTRTFVFDVMFFDLPRAKEESSEYQREVISDCARLAEDLVNELAYGNVLFGKDTTVQFDNTITTFIDDLAQVVTGVTIQGINITVPNSWNACDIPADWSSGGSSTGGTGSGSGRITLRVNGVDNEVQNILDLVQGTNIVIEDLGDGRVRIRATGGAGGGSDWGGIGGDIKDQTDLIQLLADYVTTDFFDEEVQARIDGDAANAAAITAEITARENADEDLQLAVDTVAGALSTEITARQNGDATNATAITTEASTRASADTALQSNIDWEAAARAIGDTTNASAISSHVGNTSNPHGTTKTQVGLGNVPNIDTSTTANISDSTNKRFVSDAQLVVIGNTSNTNTGDETTESIQTKRPLKTIGGTSIEGAGDIAIATGTATVVTGRIRRSTNQSIPTGGSYTDLSFDSAAYEVGGDFWSSGATITIPESGYYAIFAEASFDGTGLLTIMTANMQLLLNGSSVIAEDQTQVAINSIDSVWCMAQRFFTAGNTIKVQVKHSNATSVNVLAQGDHSPDIIITKVGGARGDVGPQGPAATQVMRITGAGFTIASGARFFSMTNGTTATVESVVQIIAEANFTATKIIVRLTTAQSASSSLVIALRVNGADSGLVLTIPASSAAGVYSVTGSVAIAEGSTINYRSATTVTSAGISQISLVHT